MALREVTPVRRGLILAASFLAILCQASATEVARSIELGNVQLNILSSAGDKLISSKGAFPTKLLSSPQITSKQTIEISFKVTSGGQDFSPAQVFLSLQRKGSPTAAYAVAKPSKKDGGYIITAPVAIIANQIGNKAGEYVATLLVGDVSASAPVSWVLGEVELIKEPGEGPGNLPPRSANLQPVSSQLPVIQHIFRSADKRPPAAVSLAFAALAFVPLLGVLLYVLAGIKVNFNAWPRDSATAIAAIVFHGLLGAVLAVYLLFWTQWNLAETLPVVLGLGLLLMLFGHKALSGIATARFGGKKD